MNRGCVLPFVHQSPHRRRENQRAHIRRGQVGEIGIPDGRVHADSRAESRQSHQRYDLHEAPCGVTLQCASTLMTLKLSAPWYKL